MRGRRTTWRLLRLGVLTAVLLAVLAPVGGPAAATPSRPTVDPTAPTPSAPLTGAPPQGSAPDGSAVGGEELDTRRIVLARPSRPLPGGISAAAWLVADAGTGEVLGARDPHGRYYPASTLKTLTLLAVVPALDPHQVVVGTPADEQIEGSRVGIVTGGRYTVQTLLQGLVLQSGNDAANALARAYGGVPATVAAMNRIAQGLGAYDTVAGTPSGLDMAGQTTSAYDLVLIFRALLEDQRTAALLRTPTAQMPPVPGRSPGWQIQNQNPLLTTYPGDVGGKTGFTDAARHTYVGAATRAGRTLVVSVLNTDNKPLRSTEQARRLLDWGFAVPPSAEPVGRLVRPSELTATATPTADSTPVPGPSAVAEHPQSAAPAPSSSPLLPAALAVGLAAVLAVAGALLTRRRDSRRALPGAPVPAAPAPPEPPEPAPPAAPQHSEADFPAEG